MAFDDQTLSVMPDRELVSRKRLKDGQKMSIYVRLEEGVASDHHFYTIPKGKKFVLIGAHSVYPEATGTYWELWDGDNSNAKRVTIPHPPSYGLGNCDFKSGIVFNTSIFLDSSYVAVNKAYRVVLFGYLI
jgi:hypothetical protein